MQKFSSITKTILILTLFALASACSRGESSPGLAPGAASVNPKALVNPVPPTEKSIAAGKRRYDRLCSDCHGPDGKGDGTMAAALEKEWKVKTSDLTDEKWDYGSTDGEIFVGIRDGVGKKQAMKGLNGKPGIVDEDIWNMVNYIRSIGPKPK